MSTDSLLPYRTMAYNNAWANHRLLTACAALSQEAFVASRTGFFPSLRATLNHILIVDRFYVDAMEGGHAGAGRVGRSRALRHCRGTHDGAVRDRRAIARRRQRPG